MKKVINEFNKINKDAVEDYKLDKNKKKTLKESIQLLTLKTVKTIKTQTMKNDIILTYLIPNGFDEIKIFGEKFVQNNKNKCYILVEDENTQEFIEYELDCYFSKDNIPNFDEKMRIFN